MPDRPATFASIPAAPRDNLAGFMAGLRQRRRTFLAVLVLVPLCAWLTLLQIAPVYTASGALIYEPSGYKLRELQTILREDPTTEAMMASQAEILQSLHIAEQIAKRGNLFDNPEFNPSLRPPGLLAEWFGEIVRQPVPVAGPSRDAGRDRVLQTTRAALHAAPVRFSHVIEVTFTATDPNVAATAVNNAMDAYIKEQFGFKRRAVETANKLMEARAAQLRAKVREAEERMSAYRSEHGLSQGMYAGVDTEHITHLMEDIAKAQSDRAAADARLDAARGKAGATTLAEVAPSVSKLREQTGQLASQLQAQRGTLGESHPAVQSLIRQLAGGQSALAAETARVVAATEAEQRAAGERLASLEAVLRQARGNAEASAKAQIPLNAMNRDLEAARGQLQSLLERMQQTAQQAAVESAEAHEISYALPPDRPSYPKTAAAMGAAGIASVLLGLLLVYLLQLTDKTLHGGEELRHATGLPCLALIPEMRGRATRHTKICDYAALHPHSAFAEQIRALRAAISLDEDRPQVVAITAARPAEGKSVLTLSLGRSAHLGGERVLAVECDARQGSFGVRLVGNRGPGLLDVLRGDTGWRDAVQPDPVTGMSFIPAGKPSGDILRLFLGERMRGLLAEARGEYDLILLDLPPAEAMTEARVAASLADATLFCVRWRHTLAPTVLHTLSLLRDAHAKICGTVLTRVDTAMHLRSGYADAGVYHRRYKPYFRES
jgi:uncharacterized protein involved in exopolysaccharide biosynthesis/Mrp family chromosome partitioning ATPase